MVMVSVTWFVSVVVSRLVSAVISSHLASLWNIRSILGSEPESRQYLIASCRHQRQRHSHLSHQLPAFSKSQSVMRTSHRKCRQLMRKMTSYVAVFGAGMMIKYCRAELWNLWLYSTIDTLPRSLHRRHHTRLLETSSVIAVSPGNSHHAHLYIRRCDGKEQAQLRALCLHALRKPQVIQAHY